MPLPVVDWADARAGESLHRACTDKGFFVLRNHGLEETAAEALSQARAFFGAERTAKLAVPRIARYGYVPTCRDLGSDERECGTVEYVDLGIADEVPLPRFEALAAAIATYQGRALTLASELLEAMAQQLGAPHDAFTRHMRQPQCRLRLLHYPPGATLEPASDPGPPLAMAPHTDYGAITLLVTDGRPGLDIGDHAGHWEAIGAPADALVVNLGDMLARWTNGIYRSTPHRVRSVDDDRYSMPFFINPHPATMIEPLTSCIESNPPQRHEPIEAGAFLRHRIDTGGYDRDDPDHTEPDHDRITQRPDASRRHHQRPTR